MVFKWVWAELHRIFQFYRFERIFKWLNPVDWFLFDVRWNDSGDGSGSVRIVQVLGLVSGLQVMENRL